MQYSFTLDFNLQGHPTDKLLHFTDAGEANIVLPTQINGGNLTANISNIHQMSIHLPILKKHVTFSSSDSMHKIRRNLALYNLACSLGSYALIHFLNEDKNQLVIQMITDVKRDYDLLKAIAQRFDEDSGATS